MNSRHVFATTLSAAVLCLPLSLLFATGCRHSDDPAAASPSEVRTAPVATAVRAPLSNQLDVAGEFVPFQEIELHAKVAGYIRRIYVDIGDPVRAGQILATLDVPELVAQVQGASAGVRQTQEQITRARSEVARAEAGYQALHASSQRLQSASAAQPGLIAQQELDDALAKDHAAAAQVDAAKSALLATQQQLGVSQAEHQRYASMADYSRITAPFSGVVTWRYADTGALIQAGTSNAASMPVVKLAEIDKLRLRLPVPESLAPFVHTGDTAQIRIQAINQTLTGAITRDTGALDPSTRTMQVEIDVPNTAHKLQPGMYAQVSLNIQRSGDALTVPIQAVDRTGPQPFVMLVDSTSHIQKRTVQTGIATANRVEILSGLQSGDRIVSTNITAYQPGEPVQPKADPMAAFNATEVQ